VESRVNDGEIKVIGAFCLVGYIGLLYLLTCLCGPTSQKNHRGRLGLGGSLHEEVHPFSPNFTTPLKCVDAGSTMYSLNLLISSIYEAYSIREKKYSSPLYTEI